MKRSFQWILALAMIAVLVLPAAAQDAEKKKKGKKAKGPQQNRLVAGLMKKLEGAELSDDQLKQVKSAAAELAPKLREVAKKRSEMLGPDVRKAMAEARRAAAADGKKGKQLQEAVKAVLSKEQQEKVAKLQKEQQGVMAGFRAKVVEIIGVEKAKELKIGRGGAQKKGKGKQARKKKDKKDAA